MSDRATLLIPDEFRARGLIESERVALLSRRGQYFDCTQHDWKRFDFDGHAVRAGQQATQPLLTAEVAPFYVPLKQRRPSNPVRLGKAIVSAFTELLFGEERWPKIMCAGDEDTQDYAQALDKAASLRLKFIEARNRGGSCGSVGMSWYFRDGRPRVEVHHPAHVHVREWQDRNELVPLVVTKLYLYPIDEYNQEKKRVERVLYWYRKDCNPEAEIGFLPVKWKQDEEPEWIEDDATTIHHDNGRCPFVWIQNLPDSEQPDGAPDYHGLYEQMDQLDLISSAVDRGTILNVDPTLVLMTDPGVTEKKGVKKGSDNALSVGIEGDAKYLELAGSSIEAGLKVKESKRKDILETAQCVFADPDQIAAAGTSAVAIKAIYQTMIGKAATLRETYGSALRRLTTDMLTVARKRNGRVVVLVTTDDEGNQVEVGEAIEEIKLPAKQVQEPVEDEMGQDTGETKTTEQELDPGEGTELDLAWGEWFPLTPQDRAQAVTAVQAAAGAKPVISQQSAAEETATIFNRDPTEEWRRLKKDAEQDKQDQAEMFQNAAGGDDELGGSGGGGGNPFAKKPNPFGPKPNPFGGGPKEPPPSEEP